LTNLHDVATDIDNLLTGRMFSLTHNDVARQLRLGAVDVFQRKRTVKTVLSSVPYVSEWDLLQRDIIIVIIITIFTIIYLYIINSYTGYK